MESKKNPAYDIHRQRTALFSIGLICSLAIVIMAFQWKVELQNMDFKRPDPPQSEYVYIPVSTKQPEPARPQTKVIRSPQDLIEIQNDRSQEEIKTVFENPTADEPTVVITESIELPIETLPTEPFIIVQNMPEPDGGYSSFFKILKNSLKYPSVARRLEIEGKVFVQFVVNEDGQLTDLKVLKGIGGGCDEEAIRVLKLTKWKPGKQRGVPVKVRMVQPIHFSLNR